MKVTGLFASFFLSGEYMLMEVIALYQHITLCEALKVYLFKYKMKQDSREAHKIIGKTPIEAGVAIVEDYELPLSKEDLLSEISLMFFDQ